MTTKPSASHRDSFAKSSIQTIAVRLILLVSSFGTGIVTARWLGPEGVGVCALLYMVKDIAFRLGNLGIGTALSYFAAKNLATGKRLTFLAWLLGLGLSLASIAVLLVIWPLAWSPWNNMPLALFALGLATVAPKYVTTFLQRILSGQLRITAVNVSSILGDFFQFLVLVVLMLLLPEDLRVHGAIAALLLGDLLRLAYLLHYMRRNPSIGDTVASVDRARKTPELLGSIWQYGRWQYLIMFATYLIEEMPILLLKSITGSDTLIGFFARARGLGRQTRLMSMPISQVLFPFTAASKEEVAVRRTNILCRNLFVISAVGVGLSCLVIEQVIVLLYGEAFRPATVVFYALAPGVVTWPTGHFLATHLSASGNPRSVFYVSIPPLVLGAVAGLWLVSTHGVLGAGIAASLIYTLETIARLFQYCRAYKVPVKDVLMITREDLAMYRKLPVLVSAKLKLRRRTA